MFSMGGDDPCQLRHMGESHVKAHGEKLKGYDLMAPAMIFFGGELIHACMFIWFYHVLSMLYMYII